MMPIENQSPSETTVATLLMRTLQTLGARVAFGIPGVHTLSIYNALVSQELRHITARNEQGAGFMAEGYARACGEPGLLLTIGGPGATNALTAIANAYADAVPLIHVSSEVPESYIDTKRGYLHAMRDQLGVFQATIGDTAYRITDSDHFDDKIKRVWFDALGPPPQPVHIEVPLDVLERQIAPPESYNRRLAVADLKVAGPVQEAARLLQSAKKPLLYVGGGASDPETSRLLVRLAEVLQAPVVTTTKGKGTIPADHPLHLGCSWAPELRKGQWFHEADVAFAVGTRLSQRTYELFGHLALPTRLIHLDADPSIIGLNHATEIRLVGSATAGLEEILSHLRPIARLDSVDASITKFRKQAHQSAKRRAPLKMKILDSLALAIGPHAVTTHDLNTMSIYAAHYLPVYGPRQFLFPMEFGVLGFSLPAAIGAKLAYPDRPVVAFAGDGSFLFSVQELATAVQEKLQIVILVFNDDSYGSVARFQKKRYGQTLGTQLTNPDFVALARSFGAEGVRCNHLGQLRYIVSEALSNKGPVLVEIPLEAGWDA